MVTATQLIIGIVAYALIPLFIVGAFIAGMVFADSNGDKIPYGWFAGIIIFVIYYVHSGPSLGISSISLDDALNIGLFSTGIGVVVGALAPFLWRISFPKIVNQIIGLFLGASGPFLIYQYLVVRKIHGFIGSVVLGCTLGLLLHYMFCAESKDKAK